MYFLPTKGVDRGVLVCGVFLSQYFLLVNIYTIMFYKCITLTIDTLR